MNLDIADLGPTIIAFCRKWNVVEFSLFGSVLRQDFSADSDVDVLIELSPGGSIGFEQWFAMREELRSFFGREVDMVLKGTLRNPFRRHEILRTRRVLYAA